MNWQSIWKLAKSDYAKLVPILLLALFIAFIPNLSYQYPVHVDEWEHLARSKAMLEAGDTSFIDPFLGQSMFGLSSNLEAGFHLFWGVFHQLSGIPWLVIFRFFPSIIFMITVLSVYTLARREGFGWEAAFITCLIPTTVGIMGPAFLVPVATGLLFIPLILFLAFNFRTVSAYLLIFIFVCFLLSIHAPSAICLIIVLSPYVLLNLKGNLKSTLGLGLALIAPFIIVVPLLFDLLMTTAESLFVAQYPREFVQLPQVVQGYGYLPLALCLWGTSLLATKGGKKNYGLVLGLLVLLLMLVTFYRFHYGVPLLYERGLLYVMLMAGIVAGAGLIGLKNLRLPAKLSVWLKVPFLTQNAGRFLCLVLVGVTLAMTIPERLDTPYYHMIDEEDYHAFVWIKDNLSEDYQKAILNPWKATAFTVITEKHVYTRISAYPAATDEEAYEFLASGCVDTAFLKKNGISIVYHREPCHNSDLVAVRKYVYLIREESTP